MLMDDHYYDDPFENDGPYEDTRYFIQEGCFGGQTGPYVNHDIGDPNIDDLELEFGNYMRVLTFIFTLFCPRTVFAITHQGFGTFAEPSSYCPDAPIRRAHQATSRFRKPAESIPRIAEQWELSQ
jgi:hypothetical protein